MNRDIFKRQTRMTHKFGELEKISDPLGSNTFQPVIPVFPTQQSGPLTIKTHGEHCYYGQRSAVQKPSGKLASLDGPAPDHSSDVAIQIPAGTKKRKTP